MLAILNSITLFFITLILEDKQKLNHKYIIGY